MNDFTKDELKSLRASISATEINNSGAYGDKNTYEDAKKLYNKLQSMIDNYCDYQWNDLQKNSIKKIQSLISDCHHIDIVIRHNGEDKYFEGDFLKQLMASIALAESVG